MEAERNEGAVEGWLRRTRFTAMVTLLAVALTLILVAPGGGGWLSGALTVIAVAWYWLPVALRSRRKFTEGYRGDA